MSAPKPKNPLANAPRASQLSKSSGKVDRNQKPPLFKTNLSKSALDNAKGGRGGRALEDEQDPGQFGVGSQIPTGGDAFAVGDVGNSGAGSFQQPSFGGGSDAPAPIGYDDSLAKPQQPSMNDQIAQSGGVPSVLDERARVDLQPHAGASVGIAPPVDITKEKTAITDYGSTFSATPNVGNVRTDEMRRQDLVQVAVETNVASNAGSLDEAVGANAAPQVPIEKDYARPPGDTNGPQNFDPTEYYRPNTSGVAIDSGVMPVLKESPQPPAGWDPAIAYETNGQSSVSLVNDAPPMRGENGPTASDPGHYQPNGNWVSGPAPERDPNLPPLPSAGGGMRRDEPGMAYAGGSATFDESGGGNREVYRGFDPNKPAIGPQSERPNEFSLPPGVGLTIAGLVSQGSMPGPDGAGFVGEMTSGSMPGFDADNRMGMPLNDNRAGNPVISDKVAAIQQGTLTSGPLTMAGLVSQASMPQPEASPPWRPTGGGIIERAGGPAEVGPGHPNYTPPSDAGSNELMDNRMGMPLNDNRAGNPVISDKVAAIQKTMLADVPAQWAGMRVAEMPSVTVATNEMPDTRGGMVSQFPPMGGAGGWGGLQPVDTGATAGQGINEGAKPGKDLSDLREKINVLKAQPLGGDGVMVAGMMVGEMPSLPSGWGTQVVGDTISATPTMGSGVPVIAPGNPTDPNHPSQQDRQTPLGIEGNDSSWMQAGGGLRDRKDPTPLKFVGAPVDYANNPVKPDGMSTLPGGPQVMVGMIASGPMGGDDGIMTAGQGINESAGGIEAGGSANKPVKPSVGDLVNTKGTGTGYEVMGRVVSATPPMSSGVPVIAPGNPTDPNHPSQIGINGGGVKTGKLDGMSTLPGGPQVMVGMIASGPMGGDDGIMTAGQGINESGGSPASMPSGPKVGKVPYSPLQQQVITDYSNNYAALVQKYGGPEVAPQNPAFVNSFINLQQTMITELANAGGAKAPKPVASDSMQLQPGGPQIMVGMIASATPNSFVEAAPQPLPDPEPSEPEQSGQNEGEFTRAGLTLERFNPKKSG